ncbi:MAG TPA: hypothetical protein V6D08_10810 [Candidatus Obscuribacterales bacterium]
MIANLEEAVVTAERDFEEANARLYSIGLTDGLPVVPPTMARIEAMLSGHDPARVVARLAPLSADANLFRIAMCAVMAGCLPSYFRVVVAAVEAVAQEEFNLLGIQTTTGTAAPAIIVNGPIAQQLGINCETNALGAGNRANATIGRALALVLRNVGGAVPGELDMSTMGQPGKYTFCFAENERESPWEPLHVSRGFDREQNTVTVIAAAGTIEVRDECSACADSLLSTFAHSMLGAGSVGGAGMLSGGEPLLLFSPDHAKLVAKERSRAEAQAFIFETARLPLSTLPPETAAHLRQRGADEMLRVAGCATDIMLVVVGGTGFKSTYVPTWGGGTRAVTKLIETS